jgi:tetratricopeptide (TPR) repeat protein
LGVYQNNVVLALPKWSSATFKNHVDIANFGTINNHFHNHYSGFSKKDVKSLQTANDKTQRTLQRQNQELFEIRTTLKQKSIDDLPGLIASSNFKQSNSNEQKIIEGMNESLTNETAIIFKNSLKAASIEKDYTKLIQLIDNQKFINPTIEKSIYDFETIQAKLYLIKGNAYSALGDYNKALTFYEKAHFKNPSDIDYEIKLADNYLVNNRYDEALAHYQLTSKKTSSDDTRYASIWRQIGNINSLNLNHYAAIAAFQKAFTSLERIPKKDQTLYFDTLLDITNTYISLGEEKKALETYSRTKQYIESLDNHLNSKQVSLLIKAGNVEIGFKNGTKALKLFEKAQDNLGEHYNPFAYVKLMESIALVKYYQGYSDEALKAYSQVRDMIKNLGKENLEYANLSMLMGLVELNRGLHLQKQNQRAQCIQNAKNDFEDAKPGFSTSPFYEAILNVNLGKVYEALNEPTQAREFYEKALPYISGLNANDGYQIFLKESLKRLAPEKTSSINTSSCLRIQQQIIETMKN